MSTVFHSELKAREIWRCADAVCFDVDSTLTKEEGIDKIAEHCGAGEKVAEWTKKAMTGSVTFLESLRIRLGLMEPSLEQVEAVMRSTRPEDALTPGIESLVSLLHARGTAVYLVSGGFALSIEPLADHLKIPRSNLFTNKLIFDENGKYAGFDETRPTCRSAGKPKVLSEIKKKHKIVVMIGDGVTDMEASPPADVFIGFGGNAVREKVRDGAPWYIYDIHDLITELEKPEAANVKRVEP